MESLDIPALYYPTIYYNYKPPEHHEVVHVRDERGNDYLVLENFEKHICITSGTIEFLVAELAYPSYGKKDPFSTDTPTGSSYMYDIINGVTLGIGNFNILNALYNHFGLSHGRPSHRQK